MFVSVVLLAGCGGLVKYDSSYVPAENITKFNAGLRNVVLFTDPIDDVQIINKPPSPLYVAGDQQVAFGEIIKSIAIEVYGRALESGNINHIKSVDYPATYKIHPRAKNYTYGFREGETALFSPNISIVIEVNLLDKNNDLVFSKSYSISLSGGASLGGDHTAAIRKLTHDAVYKVLSASIVDINAEFQKKK